MRLWSLHPQYLDPQGLVALWRETLLAQAVLRGETKGYKNHPQLDRFRACQHPLSAIAIYLQHVHRESVTRGYRFDESKIHAPEKSVIISVTTGQLLYEQNHLMNKLSARNPDRYAQLLALTNFEPHPLFELCEGELEPWERP
ncbi:MAG: DNA lyase [Burkholderiales bacterium]|nr:DNA lyase [Burkholderiales bacterium]